MKLNNKQKNVRFSTDEYQYEFLKYNEYRYYTILYIILYSKFTMIAKDNCFLNHYTSEVG